MTNVKSFLKKYWPSILTVVVTFLTLIIAFKILDVNFNPVVNKKIEKIVTVETFSSSPSIESLEKISKADPQEQDRLCRTGTIHYIHILEIIQYQHASAYVFDNIVYLIEEYQEPDLQGFFQHFPQLNILLDQLSYLVDLLYDALHGNSIDIYCLELFHR